MTQTSTSKLVTDNSNNKSSRPTLRLTNSPLPISQESNLISLNIYDLQELMKRKEKEYQEQLQIADAKRVYVFLSEIQTQQKLQSKAAILSNRRRLRHTAQQYNNQELVRCEAEWKTTLENILNQLQEIGESADEQHQKELQLAEQRLQDAKNGKGLQNAKFSKTVLEMQYQLRILVKAQRYDEAQLVNRRLQQRKQQEVKELLRESVQKERKALEKLKKKQNMEKESLTSRFAYIYQKEQIRRAKSIDKLVKNIRTYEIDPNKLAFSVQRHMKLNQKSRNRTPSVSKFQTPKINKEELLITQKDQTQT